MRLGADPEVFMKTMENQLVSVIGKVGGNKWQPRPIKGMPEGFTLQEDNVALEFGIPPAQSADEYVEFINSVKTAGLSALPEFTYSQESCAVFPESEMQCAAAHKFGCEPDFNAWTGRVNVKPQPPHPFMRSAGGHIHVETWMPKKPVIQAMDLFISVPAVLMDKGHERKKLYGKAGAYRPKSYGVEYRSPSNFWIFDDDLIRWVWNATEKALAFTRNGCRIKGIEAMRVQSAINSNDVALAQSIVNEYGLEIV